MQSFDIKWYELEVELTDHFVSDYRRTKSPELTFIAKQYAENRFDEMNIKKLKKKEQRFS
jgi:hypothetical protein